METTTRHELVHVLIDGLGSGRTALEQKPGQANTGETAPLPETLDFVARLADIKCCMLPAKRPISAR